jgi:hypothetical protein
MDQFDILSKELERRDFVMQQSLNKIDEHLGRLNGKVAEHEKILNINIPHTIDKCPQNDTIINLHDGMVKLLAIKDEDHNKYTRNWQRTGVIVAIFAVIITAYLGIKNSNKQYAKIREELREDIRISTQPAMISRGGMFYDPIDGRTYLFDSVKIYKLDSLMRILSQNKQ